MKTGKKYTNELKRQFGYLATWLPSTPLELGDIGILRRNEFVKISNVKNEGLTFDIREDETKSDVEHSSNGAVSLTAKAAGTVAPQGSVLSEADAGLIVEFTKENAILFKVNGTTSPSIKDQVKLGNQILERYKNGNWNKEWVVITELVKAESGTIIISSSSKGRIELKASGDIDAGKIDIADAELGLEMAFSRDLSTKILAENSLTPLFRASKVKGRLLDGPVFKGMKLRAMDIVTPEKARETDDLIYFGEADYDFIEED